VLLRLQKFAIFCLTLVIAATATLHWGQRRLIFPAPQERLAAPPPGYRFVETRTSDGLVLRAAYREARADRMTLVFFHGNGDSIMGAHDATKMLSEIGYGVLLVEYRGYGGNPGFPDEAGLYRDGEAAMAWLAERGIRSDRIVIAGNSIGSGPATEMAVRHHPRALILISAFADLPKAVTDLWPVVPSWLVRDKFDNVRKLTKVTRPILILHGDKDGLIAPEHARLLLKAARLGKLTIVPGTGHELAYTVQGQQEIAGWLMALDKPAR
jgi:uncharacterized protein